MRVIYKTDTLWIRAGSVGCRIERAYSACCSGTKPEYFMSTQYVTRAALIFFIMSQILRTKYVPSSLCPDVDISIRVTSDHVIIQDPEVRIQPIGTST